MVEAEIVVVEMEEVVIVGEAMEVEEEGVVVGVGERKDMHWTNYSKISKLTVRSDVTKQYLLK